MRNAFWVTPQKGFRESLHKVRGRIPTCADGITTYNWAYRIHNASGGRQTSLAYPPGGSQATAQAYGITFRAAPQVRHNNDSIFTESFEPFDDNEDEDRVPNTRAKGRWKVSVRMVANYPVRPSENLRQNWLFLNLWRGQRIDDFQPLRRRELILQGVNHIARMVAREPSIPVESRIRFEESVPSNPGTLLQTEPENIDCSWKWDLSSIEASPSAPYIFEDYLLVPAVHYCDPVITSVYSYFTGGAVHHPPAFFQQSVGLDVPDGYTVLEAQTNRPGDWEIPAPAIFSGGPLARDANAVYGDLANTTLASIEITALRIPQLIPLFSIQRLGVRTYRFRDISLGDPVSRLWNFGDLVTSTLPQPTHTFPNNGPFTIGLTINNAYGDSDSVAVTHATP